MISTCGMGEPVDVSAIPPDLSELPLLCKGCGVTLPPGCNNKKYCTLDCYHKNWKPQASTPSQSASPALRGEKRGQDDRSPVLCPLGLNPNLNAKKGRTSVSHFLSDPELLSLESLDAQQLIAQLKLSVALLSQQDKSLNEKVSSSLKDQERGALVLKQEQTIKALECTSAKQVVVISELEESVAKLNSDIADMKIAFADRTLASFSNSSRPSYAAATRSSVLVANFADGEKPNAPLTVASVESILDTKSSGLGPQHVREKDNNVYITFNDSADVEKAAFVFQKQPLFKSASSLSVLHQVVALFVDVSDLNRLQSELEFPNNSFKGQIHSVKKVYSKPGSSIDHAKIFLRTKQAKDEALGRGRAFLSTSSHRIVPPDVNREVRRCFNCQRYGHTQHECKAESPACGKCAEHHRTNDCKAIKKKWKCVNCKGGHQTGDKDCPKQIVAVARYRTLHNC